MMTKKTRKLSFEKMKQIDLIKFDIMRVVLFISNSTIMS
jgi:hypothetical protein